MVQNIVDERYGNAGKMTKEIQTDGVFGRVRKTDTSGHRLLLLLTSSIGG